MNVSATVRLCVVCGLLSGSSFGQNPPAQTPSQTAPQPQPLSGYATFKITGMVVDAGSGQPLAGAEVRATRAVQGSRPLAVATGSDGRFAFESLEAGRYVLSARKRGYASTNFQQHDNYFSSVIVGSGLDTENLVFQMRAAAAISGQVNDDAGEAVRNAQVMLFRQSLAGGEKSVQWVNQKQTDDLGRYRFSGLQLGTYYVAVSAQPWYAQFNPAPRLQAQIMRDVQAGITRGTQVQAPPAPPPQANSLDVVYPLLYSPGATDPARASPLSLLPGEQATADFTLYPLPSVHLKLQMRGNADPGQEFNSINVNGMQATFGDHQVPVLTRTISMNRNEVEVTLPPGHIQLNITQVQNNRVVTRWQQGLDVSRDAEIPLVVPAGGATVGGTVKLPAGGTLTRQCLVVIRYRETGQGFRGSITPEGTFEIRAQQQPLRPGAYDVFLSNCPAYHVDRVTSPNVKTSGRGFELGATDAARLVVELGAGLGRVDGVAQRDGQAASGVLVLLVPVDEPAAASLIRREQTNSDGSFSWTAIRPGLYTILAVDNGWNLEWAKPEVLKPLLPSGETLRVEPNGQHRVTVKVQ
jgi:5-hydroxyisourate hydrolase-like protein (transthyretin family)